MPLWWPLPPPPDGATGPYGPGNFRRIHQIRHPAVGGQPPREHSYEAHVVDHFFYVSPHDHPARIYKLPVTDPVPAGDEIVGVCDVEVFDVLKEWSPTTRNWRVVRTDEVPVRLETDGQGRNWFILQSLGLSTRRKKDYLHKVLAFCFHNRIRPVEHRTDYASVRNLNSSVRDGYNRREPMYQADHLTMEDGGAVPTGYLLAGWIELVPREVNRTRALNRRTQFGTGAWRNHRD